MLSIMGRVWRHHTHRCILKPSEGQPHQTHGWIKCWLWHNALNLSTNHRFTTCITYSGWQDPDKSQKPIPPTSSAGEGASPARETTQIQKLQSIKRRRVGGSHQGPALGDPCQPQLRQSSAEMLLHYHWRWKTHTRTHPCTHPKTRFPSALPSAWLHLWQGGSFPQPALSKGKLVASSSSLLQLHTAWPRAIGSPQTHVCPRGLSLPRSGPGRMF